MGLNLYVYPVTKKVFTYKEEAYETTGRLYFFFSLNFDIVVFEIYLFSKRNEMLIFYRKDSNNVSLVLTQCCFS